MYIVDSGIYTYSSTSLIGLIIQYGTVAFFFIGHSLYSILFPFFISVSRHLSAIPNN